MELEALEACCNEFERVGARGGRDPPGFSIESAVSESDEPPICFDDSLEEGLVIVPAEWLEEWDDMPSGMGDGSAIRGTGWSDEVPIQRRGTGRPTEVDLKDVTERWVRRLVRQNARNGKYASAVKGDILPDGVTPRDLWSSPTLRAVAVFHCPPDPDEVDLDLLPDPETPH